MCSLFIILFLHQTTTFNVADLQKCLLFIILFLHQTTTQKRSLVRFIRCLSSCSYIKPQPRHEVLLAVGALFIILFLHQTTTMPIYSEYRTKLFIILFLHQTTTDGPSVYRGRVLFIILFLHQTTTSYKAPYSLLRCLSSCSYIKPQRPILLISIIRRCLSSCSYIKPQHTCFYVPASCVVYHLVPTSNHNMFLCSLPNTCVVYHLVPTSNHN